MNITVERILALKNRDKVSDQEICRLIDAKKDKVYTWKTERSTPTTEEVAVLAKYFDVPTDYLLGNTDDPSPADKKNSPLGTMSSKEALKAFLIKEGVLPADRDITDEEARTLAAMADAFFSKGKK